MRKVVFILAVIGAVAAGFGLAHLDHLHFSGRAQETDSILYYVDPMHPGYRSDKPGIAPDCGMQLVPVRASEAGKWLLSSSGATLSGLRIDQATQQLYGIRLAKVEMSPGHGSLSVFARVAVDETRVYRINFGSPGYVRETHDDAVGTHVHKDQRLASVYSSEVIYAATGYISGQGRVPVGAMTDISPATPRPTSISARADYLRNLGMSDAQIDELHATHKIPEDVYVVSPVDGFVLSRSISPGFRFEKNADLYTIVDLSHVWIFAEVFGKDAQAFRPGAIARIILPDTGESFRARVSAALPEVDTATRTLKPRLEVDNPGFHLRPDMFVTVEIPVEHAAGLTIPADALLDSGLSKRVYVEQSDGSFAPREVMTGWRDGDRVQIVKGLSEGEKVVSSGTFLVDSESRLHMTAKSEGISGNLPKPASPARRLD